MAREDLIEAVWGHEYVTDGALNQSLRDVRLALGDHDQEMIRTLPRRGYRFDVPVERTDVSEVDHSVCPGSKDRAWLRAGTAAAILAVIAVAYLKIARDGPAELHPDAFEAFTKAKFYARRRDEGDIHRAHAQLLKSVRLAPNYAPAWAELAQSYLREDVVQAHPDQDLFEKFVAATEKALELDPELPHAQANAVRLHWSLGQIDEASKRLESALSEHPDNRALLQAAASDALGSFRFDDAAAYQQRIVELDPLSALDRSNLGLILTNAAQYEEALSQFNQVLELFPNAEVHIQNKAMALVFLERYEEAIAMLEPLSATPRRTVLVAMAYRGMGKGDLARNSLERLKQAEVLSNLVPLAEWYSYTGQVEKAFEVLQEILRLSDLDCPATLPCPEVNWIKYSPFLNSIRDSPEFQSWLSEIRLRAQRRRTQGEVQFQ